MAGRSRGVMNESRSPEASDPRGGGRSRVGERELSRRREETMGEGSGDGGGGVDDDVDGEEEEEED